MEQSLCCRCEQIVGPWILTCGLCLCVYCYDCAGGSDALSEVSIIFDYMFHMNNTPKEISADLIERFVTALNTDVVRNYCARYCQSIGYRLYFPDNAIDDDVTYDDADYPGEDDLNVGNEYWDLASTQFISKIVQYCNHIIRQKRDGSYIHRQDVQKYIEIFGIDRIFLEYLYHALSSIEMPYTCVHCNLHHENPVQDSYT